MELLRFIATVIAWILCGVCATLNFKDKKYKLGSIWVIAALIYLISIILQIGS